ncbi:MAG: translation initiation factor IF-2 [Bacilli bacterium]
MMEVVEYAKEVNLSVKEVLALCKKLNINVKSDNDALSEDDVVQLDNSINKEIDSNLESKFEYEDRAEEIAGSIGIDTESNEKKVKIKKKNDTINKSAFIKSKKDIYKKKEKLESNKQEQDDSIILYKEDMTVSQLADLLGVNVNEVVKKLVLMGLMISSNQSISFDDASIITLDYNKELKKEESADISNFENYEIIDKEEELVERPCVVTIMGHVDHGKTTLLDYIRNAHVASGEAGGITQHIGAYQVVKNGKKITFIDTPGHAAFTEMRARGASITDIVIVIVAADDGVMPQTKEAIDHAKAAGVPIIVAINKIDKPNINIERISSELSELGLVPEAWGGNTIFVNISAQSGENIDLLLDNILVLSEMLDLKANPSRYGIGTVIEAKLDKNVGPVVTLLIQNGTLRIGDPIVVGSSYGKIRTLKNDLGEDIISADVSSPVEVTGLNEIPVAGDKFMAFDSEKEARSVALKRLEVQKELKNTKKQVSLEDLFDNIKEGKKEINIVLKTDVKGSEEAVKNTLMKIDIEGVKITIVRSGTGTITESDVLLANASNALIIGFNVRPDNKIKDVAKAYGVDIRLYSVIYKIVEELEAAMKGMLDPQYEEVILGTAEVRKLFKFSKVGSIAGSHVTSGSIKSNCECRLIRDGVVLYTGKISSLQREKEQVKDVKNGFDCGITLENYSDIKEGDIVETFIMKEVKLI